MKRNSKTILVLTCSLLVVAWPVFADAQVALQRGDGETGKSKTARFDISGEHRARYESLDPQFRPFLGSSDRVLALRTNVRFEAALPKWDVLGEVVDSRAELNDRESLLNTSIVNALEPAQLSVSRSWTDLLEEGSLASVRFGRLTVDLGSRRLIARSLFRNTVNSFIGVDWSWADAEGRTFRGLYLKPTRIRPITREDLLSDTGEVDAVARDTRLRGVFYGQPIERMRGRIELYWLDLDTSEPLDRRELTTIGGRALRSASPGHWHYELEVIRQTGHSSALIGTILKHDLKHDAYFRHVELGYSFARRPSPAVSFLFDQASGDKDPNDMRNERFDPLYGARRFDFGPTGIYGPFARANLETPGIRLKLVPSESWQGSLTYRVFRLASDRDAWTTANLRDETGRTGDSLGRQVEVQVSWHPRADGLSFDFGAAYLRKGEFIRRNAPDFPDASRYFYVATMISFFDR